MCEYKTILFSRKYCNVGIDLSSFTWFKETTDLFIYTLTHFLSFYLYLRSVVEKEYNAQLNNSERSNNFLFMFVCLFYSTIQKSAIISKVCRLYFNFTIACSTFRCSFSVDRSFTISNRQKNVIRMLLPAMYLNRVEESDIEGENTCIRREKINYSWLRYIHRYNVYTFNKCMNSVLYYPCISWNQCSLILSLFLYNKLNDICWTDKMMSRQEIYWIS